MANHSRAGQVEKEDLYGLIIFVPAILLNLELVDDPTGGHLHHVLYEVDGATTAFTAATAVALLTLGYVLYTNNFSLGSANAVAIWALVITVAIMLTPPLMPIVAEFVSNTAGAWIAFLLQVGGYITLSFSG